MTPADPPFITHGRYLGQPVTIACDGRCDKAWGVNGRPRKHLSGDPDEPGIGIDEHCRRADDHVFLSDDALGEAPADPGTYEGGEGKPPGARSGGHNKWCARECERSALVPAGDPIVLPDLTSPAPNMRPDEEAPRG